MHHLPCDNEVATDLTLTLPWEETSLQTRLCRDLASLATLEPGDIYTDMTKEVVVQATPLILGSRANTTWLVVPDDSKARSHAQFPLIPHPPWLATEKI